MDFYCKPYEREYNQLMARLVEQGHDKYELGKAVSQLRIIGHLLLNIFNKKNDIYLIETLKKLVNGETTLEQINTDFQPAFVILRKQEEANEARAKEEERKRCEEKQRAYKEKVRKALEYILVSRGFSSAEYESFLHDTLGKIERGELSGLFFIERAEQLQREEWKRKRDEELKRYEEEEARKEQFKHDVEETLKPFSDKLKKCYALAHKGQYNFDGLIVQCQENSTRFLLPNENNESVTAYEVIERLAGDAFKSYKKQIKFKNDKIQILPYAERIRLVFFFRKYNKSPLVLDNADTIALFIKMAIDETDDRQIRQNWKACLEVTETLEEAASLLSFYGWAGKYNKEFPVYENTFYTVDAIKDSGTRTYNIVEDDLTLRFAAIEQKAQESKVHSLIKRINPQMHEYKKNKLQSIFKPLLWWRDGVRMGLTIDAIDLCDARISEHGDMDNDLLMGLVEGGIKGAFSAIRAAMRKPLDRLDKDIRKQIDSVVHDYFRSKHGVTFKE